MQSLDKNLKKLRKKSQKRQKQDYHQFSSNDDHHLEEEFEHNYQKSKRFSTDSKQSAQ